MKRHFQTIDADRQRRITESYSKAVEHLSNDKIEQRLGGIYTLERIAKESPDDYWTVMETLTAFVRERAKWQELTVPVAVPAPSELWQSGPQSDATRPTPATDIAAVLEVIRRRSEAGREREQQREWRFNLRSTDLRGADLHKAHLEGADLHEAHLEDADLCEAYLDHADLHEAHLEGAHLRMAILDHAWLGGAHLVGADLHKAHLAGAELGEAHLEGAQLDWAHLNRALLSGAHLKGAQLWRTHLEGACLGERSPIRFVEAYFGVVHLSEAYLEGTSLDDAIGDAKTQLPEGVPRPAHWPPYEPGEMPSEPSRSVSPFAIGRKFIAKLRPLIRGPRAADRLRGRTIPRPSG